MLLKRATDGRLLDGSTPIALRGGHYDLFKADNRPSRSLAKPGASEPFTLTYATTPCPTAANRFAVDVWNWLGKPWTDLFDRLASTGCNLLRIWATAGTRVDGAGKPQDLCPFTLVSRGGAYKWQVYQAVVENSWNTSYFTRLSAFVQAANARGVAVQISLFNYLDLTTRFDGGDFVAWNKSPYNPACSDDPSSQPGWGTANLVAPTDNTETGRHAFFLKPTNGLATVQAALARRIVQALAGQTNVIYELINEPRGSHAASARFAANVIDWVTSATSGTPIISVNASNRKLVTLSDGTQEYWHDVDYWQAHSTAGSSGYIRNYPRIDIISYHGLTGYAGHAKFACCNTTATIPSVAPEDIAARVTEFESTHTGRSLMLSTDAVYVGAFRHSFPTAAGGADQELHVRDGQIVTQLANNSTLDAATKAARSDVGNWAYWTLVKGAGARTGRVHFQNHSTNHATYALIQSGYTSANGG